MEICEICRKEQKYEKIVWYSENQYNLCNSHYRKWNEQIKPYNDSHKHIKTCTKAWNKMCKELEKLFEKWFKEQKKLEKR